MEEQKLPTVNELTDRQLMGAQKHWTNTHAHAEMMLSQVNAEVDRRLAESQNVLLPSDEPK